MTECVGCLWPDAPNCVDYMQPKATFLGQQM